MENLAHYLQKFKVLLGDKTEEKRIIQETLEDALSVKVSLEKISLRDTVATLTLSPIERTEVLLRKKEVLSLLQNKGVRITDLR